MKRKLLTEKINFKRTSTEDIYFTGKALCNLPAGLMFFVKMDENDIIQIGKSIILNFMDTDKNNIEKMKEIEEGEKFMFWLGTNESEKFFARMRRKSNKRK